MKKLEIVNGLDLTGVSTNDVNLEISIIDGYTCNFPKNLCVGDMFIGDFQHEECLSCPVKVVEIFYDENRNIDGVEFEFTGKVYNPLL